MNTKRPGPPRPADDNVNDFSVPRTLKIRDRIESIGVDRKSGLAFDVSAGYVVSNEHVDGRSKDIVDKQKAFPLNESIDDALGILFV